MTLYIKNMTTVRCKMVVEQEFQKLGLITGKVEEGKVEVFGEVSQDQRERLRQNLLRLDLDLLEDNRSILVEKIKNVIYEMLRFQNELPKLNYSDYISDKLNYDYTYLANVFVDETGTTIRQFIISLRIEKVKELILHDEFNLTEISNRLHYSSVGHLSNQFKKITGITPTLYKKSKHSY